ncbi:DUF805 domain-containing protein [Methylomonas sp. SURF-2]|uniref:DUF805 domain-containing protein n=1 Tax=Methylomonas subterranea TaxID=2952225 RepID=A0ABT1TJQ8_9GAMM|nr:DUF805 domain-containing protein [Methylomonas sp. SURF-2]MCQ8105712.1 DUF805 domain-containing protein [Methylomonas sp. SURF-2]
MPRHSRSSFLVLGLLSAANAAGLLLYGLSLSTGSGGGESSVPVVIALAAMCLLVFLYAAVNRGRDLGWSGWLIAIALGMGPVAPLLIIYLACAQGQPTANRHGPPPPPASAEQWFWTLFFIICSWFVLAFTARIL